MAPLLAEIPDKMPTVVELWGWMLLLTVPVLVGVIDQRASVIVLLLALPFSAWLDYWAYHEAFLERGFSQAVQGELGHVWIAHSLASSCLPAAAALGVFFWHRKGGRPIRSWSRVPRVRSATLGFAVQRLRRNFDPLRS